jgi:hypothetical protein
MGLEHVAHEFAALDDGTILAVLDGGRSIPHAAATLSRKVGAFGDDSRSQRQATRVFDNVMHTEQREEPKAPRARAQRTRAKKTRVS